MTHAVLTDIEGTTSSIDFVHDVLFPYAREHMAEFVRGNADVPRVVSLLDEVRRETGQDLDLQGSIAQLIAWIDADRKITPLKALQGMIWEAGYRNGDFTGHIYADAADNLRAWHAAGIRLYVFSSGSVQAQRLLFRYSDSGDLTPLFSGYYDTRIGNKRESAAYSRIASDIGLPPGDILFLSDIREELDAAQQAGMRTAWLVRDSRPEPEAAHLQASDFNAIRP